MSARCTASNAREGVAHVHARDETTHCAVEQTSRRASLRRRAAREKAANQPRAVRRRGVAEDVRAPLPAQCSTAKAFCTEKARSRTPEHATKACLQHGGGGVVQQPPQLRETQSGRPSSRGRPNDGPRRLGRRGRRGRGRWCRQLWRRCGCELRRLCGCCLTPQQNDAPDRTLQGGAESAILEPTVNGAAVTAGVCPDADRFPSGVRPAG